MTLLIDTNVLIDYVCHRGEFFEPACKVFASALTGKNKLLLTDLSYINCIYVAKQYSVDKERLIKTLIAIQRICSMAVVNDKVMTSALTSDWSDKEDALQYEAALASHADGIVTRNPKDFSNAAISVMLPVEV